MMKKVFAVAVLVAGGLQAAPYVKGKTDKDPLSYKVGEDIVFTLALEGGEKLPEGVSFAKPLGDLDIDLDKLDFRKVRRDKSALNV